MKVFRAVLCGLLCGFVILFFSSCSGQKKTLFIYNWADYLSPELVKEFETKFQCRVMIDYFDSNESMYAKLKAGVSGYDLLFPTSYVATVMYQQKMLMPLDLAKIPNAKYIMPDILSKMDDAKMVYSVPYAVSFAGIGYNCEVMKDIVPSWKIFGDKKNAGRMTMLNDVRQALGAALKSMGYSFNSVNDKELEAARDLLLEWKKNLASFSVDDAKLGLASKDFMVIQQYNGDILQIAKEKKYVKFVVPEEGTGLAIDLMVIPVTSKNSELAHQFINFMNEPENASKNMQFIHYLMPNDAGVKLVPDELKSNPSFIMKNEIFNKSEVIRDLGDYLKKYIQYWNEVKAK
jgi:spermidine/putrescine transport system substrate-binding protein